MMVILAARVTMGAAISVAPVAAAAAVKVAMEAATSVAPVAAAAAKVAVEAVTSVEVVMTWVAMAVEAGEILWTLR